MSSSKDNKNIEEAYFEALKAVVALSEKPRADHNAVIYYLEQKLFGKLGNRSYHYCLEMALKQIQKVINKSDNPTKTKKEVLINAIALLIQSLQILYKKS